MRLLDLLTAYDEALEWQEDDPLLDDDVSSPASAVSGPSLELAS